MTRKELEDFATLSPVRRYDTNITGFYRRKPGSDMLLTERLNLLLTET
jgi:hypothetical protein